MPPRLRSTASAWVTEHRMNLAVEWGRVLLPVLMVVLIISFWYFGNARREARSVVDLREDSPLRPPALVPPEDPSPTASDTSQAESAYEKKLAARLSVAAGQHEAIQALVDAFLGVPLDGVEPAERDRWLARERGCWMLTNADPSDSRREILKCV